MVQERGDQILNWREEAVEMEMNGHVGEIFFFKRSSFCKRLWGFPIGKDA